MSETADQQMASALRERLKLDGFSQVDLCRALGITEKHLSQVLNGKAGMSPDLWQRAAEQVGCHWRVELRPDDVVVSPVGVDEEDVWRPNR